MLQTQSWLTNDFQKYGIVWLLSVWVLGFSTKSVPLEINESLLLQNTVVRN